MPLKHLLGNSLHQAATSVTALLRQSRSRAKGRAGLRLCRQVQVLPVMSVSSPSPKRQHPTPGRALCPGSLQGDGTVVPGKAPRSARDFGSSRMGKQRAAPAASPARRASSSLAYCDPCKKTPARGCRMSLRPCQALGCGRGWLSPWPDPAGGWGVGVGGLPPTRTPCRHAQPVCVHSLHACTACVHTRPAHMHTPHTCSLCASPPLRASERPVPLHWALLLSLALSQLFEKVTIIN